MKYYTSPDYKDMSSSHSTSNSDSTNIGGYRYFFNGQEGDNEVFGEVANFGYEFRQYDSRLGRWWSIDPKWNEYPDISPFVFCNGSPLMMMDPNGKEVSTHTNEKGEVVSAARGQLVRRDEKQHHCR